MKLVDVYWSSPVNRLKVQCNCGILLDAPSNVSVVKCPLCQKEELWHSVDPAEGIWNMPVMEHAL